MIFYTVNTKKNMIIKKHYHKNILRVDYEIKRTGFLYTINPASPIITDYQYIIIHSLSEEDILHIKLLGIQLRELRYQTLLMQLYQNKSLATQYVIYD